MYFVERGMNPARRPEGAPLWNPLGAPGAKPRGIALNKRIKNHPLKTQRP